MTVVPKEEVERQECHSPCFKELKNKQTINKQPFAPHLSILSLSEGMLAFFCLILVTCPPLACETFETWGLDFPSC